MVLRPCGSPASALDTDFGDGVDILLILKSGFGEFVGYPAASEVFYFLFYGAGKTLNLTKVIANLLELL